MSVATCNANLEEVLVKHKVRVDTMGAPALGELDPAPFRRQHALQKASRHKVRHSMDNLDTHAAKDPPKRGVLRSCSDPPASRPKHRDELDEMLQRAKKGGKAGDRRLTCLQRRAPLKVEAKEKRHGRRLGMEPPSNGDGIIMMRTPPTRSSSTSRKAPTGKRPNNLFAH